MISTLAVISGSAWAQDDAADRAAAVQEAIEALQALSAPEAEEAATEQTAAEDETSEETAPAETASEETTTEEAAPEDVAADGPAPEAMPADEGDTDTSPDAAEVTDEVATEEAATDEMATEEAATEEMATDEAAIEEMATDEAAAGEADRAAAVQEAIEALQALSAPEAEVAATEEMATEEAATEEAATEEAATEEMATEEAATEEAATEEMATEDAATEEAAPEEMATEDSATDEAESEDTATGDVASDETAPEAMAPAEGEDDASSEESDAADRAAAVQEALSAFEALAAETAAREEEAAQLAEEEEAARLAAEEEAARLAAEEEAARLAAEEEAARLAAEEEAARLAAEEEAARLAAEEEAARLAAEEEAARLAAEEEAARFAAEEEAARLAAEEEAARIAAEEAAAEAALTQCIETAGEPSAENYPSEAAQAAALTALRDALPACREASRALPDEGAPFFHLATAAQAAGRHRRAVPLYEQAAENGVAAALTRLGDYHNFGLRPVREDVSQAVDYYERAAAAGDTAGTATLAFMYRLGRGVDQDAGEMIRLMQIAADDGYPFAQFNLGQTFLRAEGVPRGEAEALGLPDAPRAVPLLVAAANSGNMTAVEDLIDLYSTGAEGVPASDFLRGGWVDVLADSGSAEGIAARGFLYEQGIGRPANPDLAAADYIAALETGEVAIETMRGTVNGSTPRWDPATARAFQTILAERGLYTSFIDGDVGPGTIAGARRLSE